MFARQNLWRVTVGIYLNVIINIVTLFVHLSFCLWKCLSISQGTIFKWKAAVRKILNKERLREYASQRLCCKILELRKSCQNVCVPKPLKGYSWSLYLIINIATTLVHLSFYLWKCLSISRRNPFSMKGCSEKIVEHGEVARWCIKEVVL
jgi:hypothetical protein